MPRGAGREADAARCAKRDERLTFQRPLRERLRPVARASEGAAEECRSDERDTLFVSRSATNDSPSSARARAVTGPLRERRRAPLRSAGAKRETHLTTDAISVNERCVSRSATNDSALSARCASATPK